MNLLNSKQITLLQALERFPDGYITDKEGLIEEIKQQQAQMQTMPNLTPEEQASLSKLPPEQQQAILQQLNSNQPTPQPM